MARWQDSLVLQSQSVRSCLSNEYASQSFIWKPWRWEKYSGKGHVSKITRIYSKKIPVLRPCWLYFQAPVLYLCGQHFKTNPMYSTNNQNLPLLQYLMMKTLLSQHTFKKLFWYFCLWWWSEFLFKANPYNKSQSIIQIDN